MRDPFEDGGIVDKVMPWLLLGTALMKLYGDISTHGGSLGWPAAAAVGVALFSLYRIYRQLRGRRRASEPDNHG